LNPETARRSSEPAEVLVVEDSPTQALQLRHLLEQNGFRVAQAADGLAALEYLQRRKPLMIISDIMMPRMDGHEMCRRIKADTAMQTIPLVLLTSLSDPQEVIKALEAGADTFATKPYKEDALLRRLRNILLNRDTWSGPTPAKTDVFFAGKNYSITARSRQIIEFLLYSYEDAVEKNLDLIEAHTQLARAAQKLETYSEELSQKNAQMEDDLKMAREIQQAFLPNPYPCFPAQAAPEDSALRFHHFYAPSAALGGDFFCVLRLSDTQAGIFLCDVVGHGVRAALVTAIVRGLVADLAPSAGDPGLFLAEINRGLSRVFAGCGDLIFASALHLVIDAATGTLGYANAGHPCPFLLRKSQAWVEALTGEGVESQPALGLIGDTAYATHQGRLDAGDAVMLFTDGIFEVENARRDQYGYDRLQAGAQRHLRAPPETMMRDLLEEVRCFAGSNALDDDLCLLIVEFTHPAR
jgi:serine phosphatase RsbU (regulator of sigma subunit)/ActR/RegA family two-component response regulator